MVKEDASIPRREIHVTGFGGRVPSACGYCF